MRMVAYREHRHTRMWRGCALGNMQEQTGMGYPRRSVDAKGN
jgi:hypothetical protein